MSDLKRTVIITGATKGLGREMSLMFAVDGYVVIGLYRSDDAAAAALRGEFDLRGLRGRFIRQDITLGGEWPEVDGLIASDELNDVTLIANASARFTPKPFHLIDARELSDLMDVNVVGTYNVMSRFLPLMTRARAGTVVSVLSSALETKPKGFAAYLAAKSALLALTCAAAEEFRDRGIRFLTVSPGFMDTALTRDWSDHLKASMNARRKSDPTEVAAEILALAKDPGLPARGEVYQVGELIERPTAA